MLAKRVDAPTHVPSSVAMTIPMGEAVPVLEQSIIESFRVWIGVCLGLALWGCGSGGPSMVTCTEPKQSKTWLLGEVDQNFDNDTTGSFLFPFFNGTNRPVQIRVRSIGCSCYAVRRGETRLKVGDQFNLDVGQTQTLSLRPPRPTTDRASDYQFSVEYEPAPGDAKEVIECRGTLVTIAEFRINPGLLSAEFTKDSPPQRVRIEITRTARDPLALEQLPRLTGWPEGGQIEVPSPLGPAVELDAQLWRRNWQVNAIIPRPEASAMGIDDFQTIHVSGAKPGSPTAEAKLVVRFRSGLSGPRIIHFGDVPTGHSVTRRIQILARDHQPFRILGPSEPELAVSIQPQSPDPVKSHWGDLTFISTTEGEFHQILKIATDHPEQPTLEIEVRARVVPEEG